MKSIRKLNRGLRFRSEQEFQNFFEQISSAELDNFQVVDGAGGDKGFDGISETTVYQAYFPDDKNRNDKKYIAKIDRDLPKAIKNGKAMGLQIKRWIFVVPDDLRIDVVNHLISKSKETGIECLYWGAGKLTELASKHQHVTDSFPLMFMPSVKEGIEEIKHTLKKKRTSKTGLKVEIITDDELDRKYEAVRRKYKPRIDAMPRRASGSLIRPTRSDLDYIDEMSAKLKELTERKKRSDKAFSLESEEIDQFYEEQLEKAKEDFARRGLYNSGLKFRALGKIEVQKKRDIEKLKLEYGIGELSLLNFK